MNKPSSIRRNNAIPFLKDYDIPEGMRYESETVYNTLQLLGLGNFGCVLQVKLSNESSMDYSNESSIAIKYVITDDIDHPKEDFEKELLISKQISDYGLMLNNRRLFIKVFKTGITNADTIKKEWYKKMEPICQQITNMMKISNNSMYMYVLEMETCYPGNLWTYALNTYANERIVLSREAISNIVFQICYAMDNYQKYLGLRHFDIKPTNILLKAMRDTQGTTDSDFPYEVKIADFGRSNTLNYPVKNEVRLSTPNWLVAPVEWIFFFDTEVTHTADEFDMDTDLWSLGLLIIHITLIGMNISRFCHFLPEQYKEYTIYSMPHIIHLIQDHEEFINVVLSIAETVGDIRQPYQILPKLSLLLCICQLQEYLGNGFLPVGISFENQSKYFTAIALSKDEILDSCRANKANDEEEEYRDVEMNDQNMQKDNPNLFYSIVKHIKDRLGEDGLQFIRRCLQWTSHKRCLFTPSSSKLEGILFKACLNDPFLKNILHH